jgi:hypothetical protein
MTKATKGGDRFFFFFFGPNPLSLLSLSLPLSSLSLSSCPTFLLSLTTESK